MVCVHLCLIMMYISLFLASKKKIVEKPKVSDVDAANPDLMSLTEGVAPLKGQPLDDEMIMMTGNANIPPASLVDNADTQSVEPDSSQTKRDDL